MFTARIKSADGVEQYREFEPEELVGWFREHTKDGIVTDEIMLFREAGISRTKDSSGDGVPWLLTDMSLDRDGERVDPAGADLRNFKRNPVVLWAHDHSIPAIGTVAGAKLKDGKLMGKIVIDPPEVDAFAGMIKAKVERGTINAGSIGFMPHKVEIVEDTKDPTRLIHKEWELHEFSLCNVPAHPGALAERSAPKADAKDGEILDRLSRLEAAVATMNKVTSPTEAPRPYSLLFQQPTTSAEVAPEVWGIVADEATRARAQDEQRYGVTTGENEDG